VSRARITWHDNEAVDGWNWVGGNGEGEMGSHIPENRVEYYLRRNVDGMVSMVLTDVAMHKFERDVFLTV
jgi:hypothetical protein